MERSEKARLGCRPSEAFGFWENCEFCNLNIFKMRTSSIVINDQLIQTAMNLSGLKTKKEVVEKALELLIQMVNQEGIRTLRGKVKWEGDLGQMRADA